MPRKKTGKFKISLGSLILCLGFCLIYFIGLIYVMFSSLGDPAFWDLFPFALLFLLSIVFFGWLIRKKLKEKPVPVSRQVKRKPIWDVSFDGRKPKPTILTYGLMAFLLFIFILEMVFALDWYKDGFLNPGHWSIVAMGATSREMVLGGDWYRLFTAVLLHVNPLHLLANGFCLYIAGKILEHLIGRAWFLAVFLCCGLGGTLLSMRLNPPYVVSLGASGAIMGLLAAGYAVSFRLKKSEERKRLKIYLFQILIVNIVPFLSVSSGSNVDYACHLGGAITGLALGVFLVLTWAKKAPSPNWMWLGKSLAYGAVAVYLAASGFAVVHYSSIKQYAGLVVPADQEPATVQEWEAQSASLVARYPQDPRSHYFRAHELLKTNDLAGAEAEFRSALALVEEFHVLLKKSFVSNVRVALAIVLVDENKLPEARVVARPLCVEGIGDTQTAQYFKQLKLCDSNP
jgi:rhomboid protease GluP